MKDRIQSIHLLCPDLTDEEAILMLWRLGVISVEDYTNECNVSRRTAYNRLKKFNKDWRLEND